MLDNARACVSLGLLLSGYPEATTDPKAFEAVKALYAKQRPLVKQYNSASYVDGLVSGETDLAMAWSGDVLQAAVENPHLDFVVPKEGSYMWIDNLCLVKGGPNRENALKLVDYLLRGEVAAGITKTVRYASPNAAAKKSLPAEITGDPRVYPSAALFKKLRFYAPFEQELADVWNRTWNDVKVSS
jgi:spermidine/putrescine-binding protein